MERSHLPRLADNAYLGHSVVHWSLTVQDRASGWLNEFFHSEFRFLLLHSLSRFDLACAVYCLMPDHAHLLTVGLSDRADQQAFMRHLRAQSRPLLESFGIEWQKQAYDHVLRDSERDRYAFEEVAGYIMQNPTRAGLCECASAWPFSGGIVPGYPDLSMALPDYWSRFWKVTSAVRQRRGGL
jgi:putative transposase